MDPRQAGLRPVCPSVRVFALSQIQVDVVSSVAAPSLRVSGGFAEKCLPCLFEVATGEAAEPRGTADVGVCHDGIPSDWPFAAQHSVSAVGRGAVGCMVLFGSGSSISFPCLDLTGHNEKQGVGAGRLDVREFIPQHGITDRQLRHEVLPLVHQLSACHLDEARALG